MDLNVKKRFIAVLLLIMIFLMPLLARQSSVYRVERSVTGHAQKFSEKNIVLFRVYENDAEKYVISKEYGYDIPLPDLKIFENGAAVLINAFDARLTFYDAAGNEISQAEILKEADADYERAVYSAVSQEFVVIALTQPANDYLLINLFDSQGQFIRTFRVNEKHINGLSYSNNLNVIAVSVYNWPGNTLSTSSLFFDNSGSQISKTDVGFSKGMFFDESNVFIGYSNNSCFLYDVTDMSVHYFKKPSDKEMILSATYYKDQVIIARAARPVLQAGTWLYKNPLFTLYDTKGRQIGEKIIDIRLFSEFNWLENPSGLHFKTENQSIPVK
jgi:hypothetical protein